MSSAGGAQFGVALRMYTTHSCHREMTVWTSTSADHCRTTSPSRGVIVSWRSRVADMPRRQATPAGSCGGIPSVCSFTASPAVDLLATHGHRLLSDYRFDPRTAVATPRGPERGQGAARATPNRPVRRAELARPALEALGLRCTCRLLVAAPP